ncbi:AMP-binding enzyme [Streptomyces rimosus]
MSFPEPLKGQVAREVFILRDAGRAATPQDRMALDREIMQTVDRQLGAVARPARVVFVGALPKTRSGKLLRRAIQAVAEGRDPGDLTTIEDPSALAQFREALQG